MNDMINLKEPIEVQYTSKVTRIQIFEKCARHRHCLLCSHTIEIGSRWGNMWLDKDKVKPICFRCLAARGILW